MVLESHGIYIYIYINIHASPMAGLTSFEGSESQERRQGSGSLEFRVLTVASETPKLIDASWQGSF